MVGGSLVLICVAGGTGCQSSASAPTFDHVGALQAALLVVPATHLYIISASCQLDR